MKKIGIILVLIMSTNFCVSQNRYANYSTSAYTPMTYSEIVKNTQAKNSTLNSDIKDLLELCEYQLNNPKYCYGNFKDVVVSVNNRLNSVNAQSKSGFISINEVERIYKKCNKDYIKAQKLHRKQIIKESNSKYY